MRPALLDILRCPSCRETLTLTPAGETAAEVRSGLLSCPNQHSWEIADGIVRLGAGFDHEMVQREIAYENESYQGNPRLTDPATIARFPDSLPELWPHTVHFGPDFRGLIEALPIGPGSWVLDVGTAACWSSRLLAQTGARVVALDVNAADFYGLKAADIHFAAHNVYFERILESMTHLPFRDGCLDAITFNASFHHTPDLPRTLGECFRVLKPGGLAAMVNEEFSSLRQRFSGRDTGEHAGSHHAIRYREFDRAAREAGFTVRYRLAAHVRDTLSRRLPGPFSSLARAGLEAAPFAVQQLHSALILLAKPDRAAARPQA